MSNTHKKLYKLKSHNSNLENSELCYLLAYTVFKMTFNSLNNSVNVNH